MGDKLSFPSNGGTAEGYLALPAAGASGAPGVLVIQEWWGLVPHIMDLADRAAAQGFVALAPDLYHGKVAREPDEAGKMLMGLAMDQAGKEMAAAARHLRTLGAGKIGAVGFCMGGSLALWSATLSPDIVAAVGCYPAVPWERMSPDWSAYRDKAAQIHCSEEDGTSAAEGIQQAKGAIEAAGGTVELYDYPGTQHAFCNDTRPEVFDEQAARAAMERTVEFLHQRLG